VLYLPVYHGNHPVNSGEQVGRPFFTAERGTTAVYYYLHYKVLLGGPRLFFKYFYPGLDSIGQIAAELTQLSFNIAAYLWR
jgi:hypothetical protein